MNKIIFGALLMLLVGCGDVEQAKSYARTYATEMGYTVVGVSCTGTDSDGDGYVSCGVRVEGLSQPISLECSRGEWTFNTGCKVALPKLNVSKYN